MNKELVTISLGIIIGIGLGISVLLYRIINLLQTIVDSEWIVSIP